MLTCRLFPLGLMLWVGIALLVTLALLSGRAFFPSWSLHYGVRGGASPGWTVGLLDTQRGLMQPLQRGYRDWERLHLSPDRRLVAGEIPDERIAVFNTRQANLTTPQQTRSGLAPNWSPDGARLAYQNRGAIFVVPVTADGTLGRARRISDFTRDFAFSPLWSPDGRYVLYQTESYAGFRRENAELYLVQPGDAAQSEALNLTAQEPDPASSPAWSADGRRLAYVTFDGARSAIHILELASQEAQVVARWGEFITGLSWSPDGRMLAFYSVRERSFSLVALWVDGEASSLPRLLSNVTMDITKAMVWSPDSRRIAFVTLREGDVYSVRADAGRPAQADLRRLSDSPTRVYLLP
ncbi:MAG: hypothetical protein SF029_20015 [bacterium]|nr:hypothetical protein [bacterium]